MHSRGRFLSIALTAAAAFCAPTLHAENVKVAFIDPLSGPFGGAGQSVLKHLQYVAERANKEKWAGDHTFEVVGFDNKGSPQDSLSVLKTVIDQGYRYITQGAGSGAGLALLDAVNKHNERNPGKEIVYLDYAAQDPDMTNSKCSFWHFRYIEHSDMKLEALTSYLKDRPEVKKVYIIGQNYAYGHQIRRAAREYLGAKRPDVEIVGDDLHPIGQVKDFAPYIAKIKASGADTVITGNWGPDFALLIKAAKEADLKSNFYAFSAIAVGAATAMGASGEGRVKTITGWHVNNETFAGKDWVEGFKKKYNEDYYMMAGEMIFQMVGKAIRQTKSTDPVKVAFAMEDMKHNAPSGEVVMRKSDHQLQQPLYLLTWAKANGKDVKYDQENTGYGWKTDKKLDAYVASQPTSCQMKRPAMQ
jgi:branched-chain amino acid transport system substrate-binding protein